MAHGISSGFVTSADGARIAYERQGEGPAVVLIGGIFCDRQQTAPLAAELARHFTVFNFDRRGRGESTDVAPYAVAREVDDVAALAAAAGGHVALYGHSSGAGLALTAAAGGMAVTRLVLHEPPYGGDDAASKQAARDFGAGILAALDAGRRRDAIRQFFTSYGMAADEVETMANDARMQALAPTMRYDIEVMGEVTRGGAVPADLVRAVVVPTLVIVGGASPDFFRVTGAHISGLLRKGSLQILDDADHGAPAEVIAPVVRAFLA